MNRIDEYLELKMTKKRGIMSFMIGYLLINLVLFILLGTFSNALTYADSINRVQFAIPLACILFLAYRINKRAKGKQLKVIYMTFLIYSGLAVLLSFYEMYFMKPGLGDDYFLYAFIGQVFIQVLVLLELLFFWIKKEVPTNLLAVSVGMVLGTLLLLMIFVFVVPILFILLFEIIYFAPLVVYILCSLWREEIDKGNVSK